MRLQKSDFVYYFRWGKRVCMNFRFPHILTAAVIGLTAASCGNKKAKNHGPIVLGDSSTIVTEKDPKKLMDLVTDLQPELPAAGAPDTAGKGQATKNGKDTASNRIATPVPMAQALPDVAGLKAEFKEMSMLIPGITAKLAGNHNLLNANSAVYTLLSGSLDGGVIRLTGTITKVSQKYQSVVVVKNKLGTLPLETLIENTDWEPVKPGKGGYPITGIDDESLSIPKANANSIRNAVSKAGNRRHLSHKKVQEWLSSVNNVHSAGQKPMAVTLRSVIWKIEGKNEAGKPFAKQIRIDVPL